MWPLTCSPGTSPCGAWTTWPAPRSRTACPCSTWSSNASLQCYQCHHRVLTKQIFRKAKIGSRIFEVCIKFFIHPSVHKIIIFKPRIFEMLELCMSGQVFKIFLLSSLAQIMNAFIGLCKPILDSLLLPRVVHCLLRSINPIRTGLFEHI